MYNSEILTTTDLYEAAYYRSLGYDLVEIEPITENGKHLSSVTLSGDGIKRSQLDYLNAKAIVNIIDFRRHFNRLKTMGYAARKNKGGTK